MQPLPRPRTLTAISLTLVVLAACERKAPTTPTTPPPTTPSAQTQTAQTHGGAPIPLGQTDIGPFHVLATRDQGDIVPGKDAPIDLTITPAPNATRRVRAVRFWIGVADAKGSVKAKASVENPDEPNRWHTHAEIPNPIPEHAQLWVEIEDEQSTTHTGSFGLNIGR